MKAQFFIFTLLVLCSCSSLLDCFLGEYFHSNSCDQVYRGNSFMPLPRCLTSVAHRKPVCLSNKQESVDELASAESAFVLVWSEVVFILSTLTKYSWSFLFYQGEALKKCQVIVDTSMIVSVCGMRSSYWLPQIWQQFEHCPWVNKVHFLHCFFLSFTLEIILSVQKPVAL